MTEGVKSPDKITGASVERGKGQRTETWANKQKQELQGRVQRRRLGRKACSVWSPGSQETVCPKEVPINCATRS